MNKLKPKKSLGQNFLKNKTIVNKILESADLTKDDIILEIGPGKGFLTEELVKKCKKVIAVEIDKNLVEYLKNKFKENEKIEVVEGDILKINIRDLFNNSLVANHYRVVANIPYYITSPIIRYFLENEIFPQEMILMVQKEVAQRIVAGSGNHSVLSLSVQYYAKSELLFYVDKNNFDPVPEVDSAMIRISHIKNCESKKESDNFFRVVRAGFCAKRKTIVNNLANSFHLEKKEVEEELQYIGIKSNSRAQEISLEEWKRIAKADKFIKK